MSGTMVTYIKNLISCRMVWMWKLKFINNTRRLLFQKLQYRGVGEGATPFPGLLLFTLDPYLIIVSVKLGGIKYYFFSLWNDSNWD